MTVRIDEKRHSMSKWRPTFVALVMVLALTACSEDPDPVGNHQNFGTNTGQDTGHDDTGELDAGDDVGPGDDVEDDPDIGPDVADGDVEEDVDEEEVNPCGPVIDLGVLEDGVQTLIIDFDDWEDHLATTCPNAAGGNTAIFSFTLAEAGNLTVDPAEPVAIGFRSHNCVNDSAELLCEEDGPLDVNGVPGIQFFWVFEKLPDTPDTPFEVELHLRVDQQCPDEFGDAFCVDQEIVEVCNVTFTSPDIPFWLQGQCPLSCEDDRCVGDRCDNAVRISESTDFGGITLGLTDSLDSAEVASCEGPTGEELTGIGRDFVVELEDLTTDHLVHVEMTHAHGSSAFILIKSTCSSEAECVEVWTGDGPWTFEPPADGNYFLIVDSELEWEGEFELSIDIVEPF